MGIMAAVPRVATEENRRAVILPAWYPVLISQRGIISQINNCLFWAFEQTPEITREHLFSSFSLHDKSIGITNNLDFSIVAPLPFFFFQINKREIVTFMWTRIVPQF